MSTTNDCTETLHALMKRLRAKHEGAADSTPPCDGADPITHQLVYSFLLWRTTPKQAQAAMARVRNTFVDYNELRICLPHEVALTLGPRHPLADERAARLRVALNQVYTAEQTVNLARLRDCSKRDARTMLESIAGVPWFVAGRVMLLELGVHAFPVDERVLEFLTGEGACEETTCEAAGSWLERRFRAGEAAEAYLVLEAALASQRASRRGKSSSKKSTNRTTKKSTAKKQG